VEADLLEAVFADLEEYFEVRCLVVLKGLAMGARLMVPSEVAEDVVAECFLVFTVVSTA
jgi:hypothetical protein